MVYDLSQRLLAAGAAALLVASLAGSAVAHIADWDGPAASDPRRAADPLVLTGAQLPSLVGRAPSELVAWRYADGWQQIPIQVDERALVDYGTIYQFGGPIGVTQLVYTDPETWTGADPDASIDADDEVVLMLGDAGNRPASWSEPTGVITQSGLELELVDPLSSAVGYVYLFRQDGSLDPAAGQQYVQYTFDLLSGDYKTTYDPDVGPHPEDSQVVTPRYRSHFGDRWINDQLSITAGGVERPDLLDRHKALFEPGNCERSEDTFSQGVSGLPVGVFIANKSGPVRAIRSFLGANSGPLTQREHVMYAGRQDIRTMLRVHSVPGILDFYDYSSAASGMQYANNHNPNGVTIDGQPDQPVAGALRWELVTGDGGSLAMIHTTTTDIPGFAPGSYYLDDSEPSGPAEVQCTSDAAAYGASGLMVEPDLPCTDQLPQVLGGQCPTTFNTLATTRTVYYDAPGMTTEQTAWLADALAQPPEVTVRAWRPETITPSATTDPTITPTSTMGVPQNPAFLPLMVR